MPGHVLYIKLVYAKKSRSPKKQQTKEVFSNHFKVLYDTGSHSRDPKNSDLCHIT